MRKLFLDKSLPGTAHSGPGHWHTHMPVERCDDRVTQQRRGCILRETCGLDYASSAML